LKKVGGQMNMKDKLKDLVSRKDLEAILEMKVDKVEFDMQLQQLLQNTKRNRKLTSMNATGAPAVDDAIDLLKPGTLNKKAVVGSASQPNLMASGAMRGAKGGPESQEALLQQQQAMGQYGYGGDADGEDYAGYPGPFHVPGEGEDGNEGGGTRAGGVGFTTEFPKIPNAGHTGGAPGRKYPGPGEAPVMAIGRSVGNTSPGRGGPEGAVDSSAAGKTGGAKGADFGSYARGKSKNPVTSSSLPTPVAPGQFRAATEAGRAGGQPGERATTPGGSRVKGAAGTATGVVNAPPYVDGQAPLTQQQWVALGNEPASYSQYVQHVATVNPTVGAALTAQLTQPSSLQGAVPDHTSFMQGPVVGGGFNTHAKHLQHKMPGAKPVVDDDVEGKGL
jgi:hypothetical protein